MIGPEAVAVAEGPAGSCVEGRVGVGDPVGTGCGVEVREGVARTIGEGVGVWVTVGVGRDVDVTGGVFAFAAGVADGTGVVGTTTSGVDAHPGHHDTSRIRKASQRAHLRCTFSFIIASLRHYSSTRRR